MPGSKREFIQFYLLVGLLGSMIHLPTFFIDHQEGDELVYLGLSQEMSWSLQNYSTAGLPGVSEFPAKLYREPLFLHPPLYPLLLKTLSLLGPPVLLGLAFNCLLHIAICGLRVMKTSVFRASL
jgi:hypothetical protein